MDIKALLQIVIQLKNKAGVRCIAQRKGTTTGIINNLAAENESGAHRAYTHIETIIREEFPEAEEEDGSRCLGNGGT